MNGVMMTMLVLASCGVLLAVADQEHAFISDVESPFKIGETDPESSHFARFEKWAEEMEKEYECEMEKMNRYSIFKENMAYADAANEVRFKPTLSLCLEREHTGRYRDDRLIELIPHIAMVSRRLHDLGESAQSEAAAAAAERMRMR